MLTAKIGETIINCIDGKYDRYRLKQWSSKKLLKCPVCEGYYEYCHGEIISPYFRHVGKECGGYYSEPETDEHRKGKLILYNWIKEQEGVTNCKLESWIPETKQRPDVYFEYNGESFVIEYQCTPIASEFLIRKELYKLAGINDLWILGTEKYNLFIDRINVSHSPYYKTIEKYSDTYLDAHSHNFYIEKSMIESLLPFNHIRLNDYYKFNITDFILDKDNKMIKLKQEATIHLIENDIIEENRMRKERRIAYELDLTMNQIISNLNEFFKLNVDESCEFSCRGGNSCQYIKAIEFKSDNEDRTFFLNSDQIDYCTSYLKSIVTGTGRRGGVRWGKVTKYEKIKSLNIDKLNKDNVVKAISECLLDDLPNYKKIYDRRLRFNGTIKDFSNVNIILINAGKQRLPDSMRFKFLKDFCITEDYIKDSFMKELKFLKHKKVTDFIFMIPKYNHYHNSLGFKEYVRVYDFNNEIVKFFKSFGFRNVKYLDESE